MQNDEVVRDIDIAIELESASECSCDPEVGWFCERCFVISTLEKSRSLLTPRALDSAESPRIGATTNESGELVFLFGEESPRQ